MVQKEAMTDWNSEAFSTLADSAKQLITLATGTIAFTVSLAGTFAKHATNVDRRLLTVGWTCLFLTVLSGLLVLFAITGQFAEASDGGGPPDMFDPLLLVATGIQQLAFLAGMLCAVIYGLLVLRNLPRERSARK